MSDKRRRFLVIGLGHFGWWVAETLYARGHDVIAIDRDGDRVDRAADHVTLGVVGDASEPEVLEQAGIDGVEAAVVSTGNDLASSILSVLALKDAGITEIYVKVTSRRAARALEAFHVTETIFPERDSAERLAQRIGSKTVLDYLPLAEGYSIQEIAVPDAWLGQSLAELDLPARQGIQVVAILDVLTDTFTVVPDARRKLTESDVAVVLGKDEVVARILGRAVEGDAF